jgi:uncharacterized OB-fold protein
VSGAAATAGAARGALTTGEFFAGVRDGRLIVQRCTACGALTVPPKVVCPACEGQRFSPATLAGDGEVVSYTVIRVPPARLAAEAPYVVSVVRMVEGVSLLGRLGGVPVDAVRVGMPVRFVPPPAGADPPVLTFRPR